MKKQFFVIIICLTVIVLLSITFLYGNNQKIKHNVTQIKKTSEVQAMGFTNPSKASKIDIEEAQAIIKSNIDVAEYLQESKGNFKFLVRHERRICMHQIEFDGRISFEFEFLVDFNTRVAKLSGEHPISSQYKAMKLVVETQKIAQRLQQGNRFYLLSIIAEASDKEQYTVMVEEYPNSDFKKPIKSEFYDVTLNPDKVEETDVPT